ncbi:MAG: 2-oxoacid:acceptor oxidoreductase family protein [Candidatus Lokiarchaeia archaeon]|nr:2-oxoacid:acceptor oxidoreductase family protein [Candidatus Lokiarchaeia archaeon]
MSSNNYTIVISGLGGQGLIKLLQILGNAIMINGYEVITSETHGLSQRGGKVICFIRFGNTLNSPIPMIGTADMIIALEESCIFDALKYAKPNKTTKIIISSYEKQVLGAKYPSVDYILNEIYKISDFIYVIPLNDIALKHTENIKTMNSVLLGYILKFLSINKEDIEKSLAINFSGMTLELNIKAFNEGLKL